MKKNSDQPQKWTVETVREIRNEAHEQFGRSYEIDKAVADAHNAALDVEREWSKALYQNLDDERKSHRRTLDTLVAERETHIKVIRERDELSKWQFEAQKQLAAKE